MVRFYDILESESQFLGEDARRELPNLGQQFGELYSAISTYFYERSQRLFKLSPKLHLFMHLCELAVIYGNPRFYWTFADEDLVGHMIEICETVHPATMPITALMKWLHVVFD